MNNSEKVKDRMNKEGITLRGYEIKGRKDKFGDEYIYDTKECVEMSDIAKVNWMRGEQVGILSL